MSRRQCRLLFQQAEASLAAKRPDACVHFALQALPLARALHSQGNINWAAELYAKLKQSRWRYEPLVGELAAALVGAQ